MAELSVDLLLERLAKGKPVPGILLLGPDTFLRDACRDRITEAYVEEAGREWAVSRFTAPADDVDRVIGQAQTLPMLVPRQVLFWSDVDTLERLGEKGTKTLIERLGEYFKNPAPFTTLVFESSGLDARMRLSKLLSEECLVVACELTGELADRVKVASVLTAKMANDMGVAMDAETAHLLAETTNADLTRIRTEITKLATYVADRRRITSEDVEAVVVSDQRYDVWQLSGILASGDRGRALLYLESLLREGEQPAGMVGAIAWMFRKLIEVQDLPRNATEYDVARLGMRSQAARLALVNARRIPREQLVAGIGALSEADSRLKSGGAAPRAVMEFLIARLTAQNAVPTQRPA
jgi:DNA polymerase-3 subunit delta